MTQSDPVALAQLATHFLLKEPDHGAISRLVEALSGQPHRYADVVKFLQGRVQHVEPHVAINALTVADTLFLQCPAARKYLGTREFLASLVNTLPKEIRQPPRVRIGLTAQRVTADETTALQDSNRERWDLVLSKIQGWAKGSSIPIFAKTYQALLDKGVNFPSLEPSIGKASSQASTAKTGLDLSIPDFRSQDGHQPSLPTFHHQQSLPTFHHQPVAPGVKAPPLGLVEEIGKWKCLSCAFQNSTTVAYCVLCEAPRLHMDAECRDAAHNAAQLVAMTTNSNPDQDLSSDQVLVGLMRAVQAAQERAEARMRTPLPPHTLSQVMSLHALLKDALQYHIGVRDGTTARRALVPRRPDGDAETCNNLPLRASQNSRSRLDADTDRKQTIHDEDAAFMTLAVSRRKNKVVPAPEAGNTAS